MNKFELHSTYKYANRWIGEYLNAGDTLWKELGLDGLFLSKSELNK